MKPNLHSSVARVSTLDDARALAGAELGPTRALLIDQGRIDDFARATDDAQWIHVDPVRAASGPFGGTIAHGYLSLSLCSRFLGELIDVKGLSMVVNYGLDRVRFPAPVRVGSAVQARAAVVDVIDVAGGVQTLLRVTIEIIDEVKPACVADALVRMYA
jgi:acyl dehydratase